MSEKSYVFAHGKVCFYEATFLCGLRFPIHPFIMELLHYLNIVLGQLMLNSWRIVISYMVIWTIIADGDMIRLNKFVHLYRLKESKEFGYYKLVPWDRRSRLIVDLPSSFCYWKSRYFFLSWVTNGRPFLTTFGGRFLGCYVDERPLRLVRLISCQKIFYLFILIVLSYLSSTFRLFCSQGAS